MKKHNFQEMEFFSHFEPKNWFQRNEEKLAIAGVTFAVVALLTVSILNYTIL